MWTFLLGHLQKLSVYFSSNVSKIPVWKHWCLCILIFIFLRKPYWKVLQWQIFFKFFNFTLKCLYFSFINFCDMTLCFLSPFFWGGWVGKVVRWGGVKCREHSLINLDNWLHIGNKLNCYQKFHFTANMKTDDYTCTRAWRRMYFCVSTYICYKEDAGRGGRRELFWVGM